MKVFEWSIRMFWIALTSSAASMKMFGGRHIKMVRTALTSSAVPMEMFDKRSGQKKNCPRTKEQTC